MSDFIESAKNFLNTAVSRTGWEAQKQMRVRGKQGEIDKLLEQRQQLLNDLTVTAMNLYQQGALTDSQLSRLCASIIELDHDVKRREEQLDEVKRELYPADQYAPGQTTNYTPPSPNQGNPNTNPQPGTPPPASSVAPNYQPVTGNTPTAQGQTICPNCKSVVRPNALYCRACGAKLR
ncbi:zinc ribbon domain-containing protein [Ktedonobacter racemifer]|uniref:Zinc-ribbon domain-containing protein n=1 Tax=Ktedonobacter racemifer DSM 44963 TaxID=485913 RepID=D6TJ00_KTERA|nr:zinc ribbon domain-containing protein [Ktedonobacter racemifer]EFH89407.1 hypothetical protein Krac_10960 [Ktedonobacter racemifer DSM 44963]